MSTVAYPVPSADAASGGVQVTAVQWQLADSATSTDALNYAQRILQVKMPFSIPATAPVTQAGGVVVPTPPDLYKVLAAVNQLVKLSFNVCVPTPVTIRGVQVWYHCPYEVIQPSLLNNRKQIALAQYQILYTWIKPLCAANPSSQLCQMANQVYSELTSLPTVKAGDRVEETHYNALFDYVTWAMDVIESYVNVTNPIFAPAWNALTQAYANMAKVYIGELLTARQWNYLTAALAAIDVFLQYVGQQYLIPITLTNPGYTYPSGQQIPIRIPLSVLQNLGIDTSATYVAAGTGFGVYDASFNKIYTWIETVPNQGLGYVQLWIKPSDAVLSQLNSGQVTVYLAVANNPIVDGNVWGISGGALGNTALDNIANVMDPGLLFTAWASTANVGNSCSSGSPIASDPLTTADMSTQSLTYTPCSGYTFTLSPIKSQQYPAYLATQNVTQGYAPCTATSSQTGPSACGSSYSCMLFTSMLFDIQNGYSCGTDTSKVWGITGYNPLLIKAIGWISVNWSDTLYAIVDDGIKVWLGKSGALGPSGVNWDDASVGKLESWIQQAMGTIYSLTVPRGTWRFELHYANAQSSQIYLGVWPPQTYLNGFYHAKYLSDAAVPHAYIYGTEIQ